MENKVNIGDISNVSGQIFIGDFNNVVANLNNTSQIGIAESLRVLKEAVMASKDLSDNKKKEQIEVISHIGIEAVKPESDRRYSKALKEGVRFRVTFAQNPDERKAKWEPLSAKPNSLLN